MATDPATCVESTRLHDQDFYAWTRQQADALRRLAETRPNAAIDFENLIDEVEGLGEADVRTVQSQLRRLMQHLLKLEFSPSERPRRQWLNSADEARAEIALHITPSIRARVELTLAGHYARARKAASRELADHDEREAAAALPSQLPFTLEQLLEEEWYPANRHGLIDEEL